jgi:hypothetical protein
MIREEVEECLKKLLQRNIKLQANDKVLKEGKFILFNVKDFYIIFTFRNIKNEIKKYEIPIPFKVRYGDETTVFDYRFKRLAVPNAPILMKIKCLNTTKKSKFYNTTVQIVSSTAFENIKK